MSLVQDLTPINLEEEKQKFFDNNFKYNPQFKYKNLITINQLYKYGKPKSKPLELAKLILEEAFFGKTETELREIEGEVITKELANNIFKDFLEKNKIQNQIKIKWSKEFPGKASFYLDTLKLRLPPWHRQKEFLGTIYHELGTHALRRINYEQQPFFKKKAQYGFIDYMVTEEGLASFHTLLAKNFKIDYMSALNYVTCDIAQHNSFSDTFSFVAKYLQDKERCWQYTYKLKRGLYDTSQGGGFTKNIVYLEGMIKVWNYFKKTEFDLEGLYFGKIDADDVEKARELNDGYQPVVPHFYKNNRKKYLEKILLIARSNHLEELD